MRESTGKVGKKIKEETGKRREKRETESATPGKILGL
jgi:hypothetical protein